MTNTNPTADRPIPNAYVVAAGRLYAGEYPGLPAIQPAAALEQRLSAFLDAGIDTFIDLTEARELDPYAEPLAILGAARQTVVVHERHPIPDAGTCSPDAMRAILDAIDQHHDAGRVVYVHCWGGIGRTGMTVGCWLVRHGLAPAEALARVDGGFRSMPKVARMPGRTSPETSAQTQVVRQWRAGL